MFRIGLTDSPANIDAELNGCAFLCIPLSPPCAWCLRIDFAVLPEIRLETRRSVRLAGLSFARLLLSLPNGERVRSAR